MKKIHPSRYDFDDHLMISKVGFIRQLRELDESQYQLLIKQTRLVELDQGEKLLEEGSSSQEFFALLRGKLDVYEGENQLGHVSAGQLIGVFSLINETVRSASLIASGINGARVLGINYSMFGKAQDFSTFNLITKLCLYREMERYTRWKLDEYVRLSDDESMLEELDNLHSYLGERSTLEELYFLEERIVYLSSLFSTMNEASNKA